MDSVNDFFLIEIKLKMLLQDLFGLNKTEFGDLGVFCLCDGQKPY